MLTEFHGDPVTGGTFPALIWKRFMEKALKDEEPVASLLRPFPTWRRRSSSAAATG